MSVFKDQGRDESMLRLLLAINRKTRASVDLHQVLDFILGSVGDVIPYDAARIYLVEPETRTVKYLVGRVDDKFEQAEIALDSVDRTVAQVLVTGEPFLGSPVTENPVCSNLRETTRSRVTVPIQSDGYVIGAFDLESDQHARFEEGDLEWLSLLASQTAVSITRTVPYHGLIEKKRLEEQLRIAREVQLSLLPTAVPQVPGLDLGGVNIPSEGIGGDYFDFIPIVDGHLGIVVADVVGKGIPASLIMASFRAFLRAEIRNNYAIRTIFGKVNKLLTESLKPNQFVSAFYGVLDLERRRFTYSNAGHHPAIVLRPDGQVRLLSSGGTVLGILDGTTYNERVIDLVPGDILLLYTDGVVEAENEAEEMFGRQRLEDFVRANAAMSARELCEQLCAELTRFSRRAYPEDDTTIVVAKLALP